MIKNTLLILGAGSSAECGFPVGERLIRDIYEFAKGRTKGFNLKDGSINELFLENKQLVWRLLDIGGLTKKDNSLYGIEDIDNFADALWAAQPRSIDEFLYDRKEFSHIGKICILCCLSKFEDEKGLKPVLKGGLKRSVEDEFIYPNLEWYRYLWHSLTDGVDGDIQKFKKNKLQIITFNYDRSLEEFLIRAIQAKFGLPEWEAFDLLKEAVSINHVYGDLGMTFVEFNYSSDETKKRKITWVDDSPRPMPYKPFQPEVLFRLWGKPGEYGAIHRDLQDLRFTRQEDQDDLAKTVIERALRIKIYKEESPNELTNHFKELITASRNIIFIGFAYHKQNLDVLGLGPNLLSYETNIFGTAYVFSNQEVLEKRDYIRKFINLPNSTHKTIHIYNVWEGFSEEGSIIRNFFRNVEGAKLS